MTVFFQMMQNINVGGRINKSQYQYTLQSSDTDDAVQDSRRRCATRSPRSTGLLDVNTDLYVTNPQVMIEVDREKAAVYGITIDQVRQELFDAFGTRQVATIYTAEQRLSGDPGDQAGVPGRPVERCQKIFVKTNGGGAVSTPAGGAERRRRARASPATASRRDSRSRCRR